MVGNLRLGRITRHRVRTTDLELRQRTSYKIQDDASVTKQFPELGDGCATVVGEQIGLTAKISRIVLAASGEGRLIR